ncbi:hypothetical protein E1B28_011695 [Marasmius oreades]|uniref:Uncharacterized protein n=1 Tax=Marasmius oreades TaxID=181124 RepID=A0A9P7UQ83_9AGAR|nr:uncharacterized protein E1B28_011695 [Marasmius oreades]KAG7090078.1 hypothetical protein E1B28_011695 [Marasmius oreades]
MAPPRLVVLFFVGWTHILLYGFNAVLFVVGIYLLRKRKDRQGSEFLFISSSLLFTFATISAIVSTVIVVGGYLSMSGSLPTSINLRACSIIQYLLVHLIDLISFTVLAYRCFHIWGGRYLVIALPVVIFLAETGVYYSEFRQYMTVQYISDPAQESGDFIKQSLPFTTAVVVLAAVSNALLTVLIAGRMWWMKRQIQYFVCDGIVGNLPQRYESIIAMTMESGMIIPTFIIIYTVVGVLNAKTGTYGDVIVVLSTILPQIVAFAPLIILVRVGLGIRVERDQINSSQSSQGRTTVPHVLSIHRDVTVSVSVAPPEDVELGSISKGQKF